MWWFFKKIFEDENEIEYAFSRESKTLKGRVRINLSDGVVVYSLPEEGEANLGIESAIMWARMLITRDGAPDEKMIATG